MAPEPESAGGLPERLRYLVLARMAFAAFLLAAAVAVEMGWGEAGGSTLQPLYLFTAAVFVLSLVYLALGPRVSAPVLAYAQLLIDTACASALVYITGGMESIFTFLYFPVIIAASALLYRPGGLVVASASAILFGLLVDLHYYGLIHPGTAVLAPPEAAGLLYKVAVHIAAFYLVAWLTAYLAEEARTSATQLSAKEQEVERLEGFNRDVIQSVTSGLITVDTDGRVTLLNRAAEHILNLTAAQVLGRPLEELLPEVAPRMEALISTHEAVSGPPRADLLYQRPGTNERLFLGFSLSPLRDGQGSTIGRVLIFRDLTRLRHMEDRVRQLDRLAAVGELAAGLAHEIRNPLAAISGGVQMLATEPASAPDTGRLLAIVQREVRRLNGLIEDFLAFARPGRRPRQRLDLALIATEALEALSHEAALGHEAARRVNIERDLEEGLYLEASPEEMRQVVSNLLRNAIEAMSAAGPGGTLRLEAGLSEGEVRLAVSDTGCGISEEDQSRIFSPFFTRKERGTGLGLAIVHAIVEAHGGRIEVDSAPGATTFTVWLPCEPHEPLRLPQSAGATEHATHLT